MPEFFSEVVVVIVLYKQEPVRSAAYTSLREALMTFPSAPEVFVYDNSPVPAYVEGHAITYFHDAENSGVSRAYNRAVAFAAEKRKNWMLFLDQDTTIQASLFEKFREAVAAHPGSVAFVPRMKDRKGLVSPFYFAAARGKRIQKSNSCLPLEKFRFVNSGLLIHLPAFLQAGGYDERIPLDFSDISFGQRLLGVTDHFRVIDVTLFHRLSATEHLPLTEVITRFRSFCHGAFAMGKASHDLNLYRMRAFLRAFHLACRYLTLTFIKIAFRESRNG